jgi:hypothetical protein
MKSHLPHKRMNSDRDESDILEGTDEEDAQLPMQSYSLPRESSRREVTKQQIEANVLKEKVGWLTTTQRSFGESVQNLVQRLEKVEGGPRGMQR